MTIQAQLTRACEKFLVKHRYIVRYRWVESTSPVNIITVSASDARRVSARYELSSTASLFLDRRTKLPDSWTISFAVEAGKIVGYSSLHVPADEEWLDSLPTKPGEARESGTFVEESHRGRGIRRKLLAKQAAYCSSKNLLMWAIIEAANTESLRSSLHAGGYLSHRNTLIKVFGYNILSTMSPGPTAYLLPRNRKRKG